MFRFPNVYDQELLRNKGQTLQGHPNYHNRKPSFILALGGKYVHSLNIRQSIWAELSG